MVQASSKRMGASTNALNTRHVSFFSLRKPKKGTQALVLAVLTAGSVAWLTISEGRNCVHPDRDASHGHRTQHAQVVAWLIAWLWYVLLGLQ